MPPLPESLRVDPEFAALLQCAAFLELSEDDVVDPDSAVEVMEAVTVYFQRLPHRRIVELQAAVDRTARYARSSGYPQDAVDFLDDFIESMGLESARQ